MGDDDELEDMQLMSDSEFCEWYKRNRLDDGVEITGSVEYSDVMMTDEEFLEWCKRCGHVLKVAD